MSATVRLTMAQAVAKFLANQMTEIEGETLPLFAGVWAIFGHGNVAGLGEALYQHREDLPTYRAHNEQAMVHSAVAFAKASARRRMMACTTSIGPGALNLVTGAGVAHVNRLPVLLLPGDIFANRRPEPVLQQVEDFGDGTVSANDCLKPVSRYYDRISRPEQIIPALRRTMQVLTDPAECGPVTLSMCQDVQAEAYDYPVSFFERTLWTPRRIQPDRRELDMAAEALRNARKPAIIAGGGVYYSEATSDLRKFAEDHGIPVAMTQAGKSVIPDDHPMALGSIGVTGTAAANAVVEDADIVLAVGTRLQDFTTGSWSLFKNPDVRIVGLNVQPFDAGKHGALPLVCDARVGLEALSAKLGDRKTDAGYAEVISAAKADWQKDVTAVTASSNVALPSDSQVIGAVQRAAAPNTTIVGAAGSLPGELHKLWQAEKPGSFHLEYGFSCMGYEIAGGIGVKMARPQDDVVVMLGDGSYLMMNSEIATSVMLGQKMTIVVLDNRGFGCINRLQMGTGGANFNNLLKDAKHDVLPDIDFRAHAESLGAEAHQVASLADLESAVAAARNSDRTTVIVIDTDPLPSTEAGGHWWDVAVPEVSVREEVREARSAYEEGRKGQR
ncbi:3D-(3,5/4)-trihydroxycyclohexane-1,2-dione acylhydrolase (decyclizing) [Hoeflea poritis]|uniref:3D-(3,5/4)-trihydroxycyclohexane-1,2-dione acylhydrolase (Decyclizing) n=1 Tax=Hoeflea poritis TaxID=2993659 RepID=A0ABT4VIU5_9HYPH|nr:3D-(3,5/4)-trihydroxycyclohexane-1,2-dione acylhydrolase (decyclizing) [Hoeflea poritis]MDA4844585.1 3D-(3,5/4)-trihydroxycyclohexane-1,2-dione acylhydrolase (decyclizing) [Hoeflea poritis]